jgi:iron complex outermembrane recepter protein
MKLIALATASVATPLLAITLLLGTVIPAAAQTSTAPSDNGDVQTVIVTARKREESLAEVPTSITAFTAQTIQDYNIQSFNDYATKTPNVSFTYGGGPTGISDARTIAIRGITGQNLFGTNGATGFYIDDTPVPGSIDPRVVDLNNIEVLKGPQGTLFGESSLGGNVRLITNQPDLNKSGLGYMVQAGATSGGGSPDGGANAIANIVLVPGTAALRVVMYGNHDAGYLTRTYPTDPASPGTSDPYISVPRTSVGDQGAISSYGGSASLLVHMSDALDIKARVLFQDQYDHGFPATFAPLPNFTPDYTLDRAFDVQPYARDNWIMPTLDVKYAGTGWSFTWANSYFYRRTQDVEDSSYGTQQVLTGDYYNVSGLPAQPYMWDGEHYHNQITSEARVAIDPINNFSGTFGVYYSKVRSKFLIPDTFAQGLTNATVDGAQAWPNDLIWTQTDPGTQQDASVFGEVYYKFLEKWTATVGLRQYWLKQTSDFVADGFMNFGPTPSDPQSNSQSGLNPKFALAYQATDEAMVYASASKGFRAGGSQPFLDFCSLPGLPADAVSNLKSDTLWTYELGSKVQLPHLLISGAIYDIEWSDLQQQVALPCGYYLQLNGGKARIKGAELEAQGRVVGGLSYRLGLGYEDTNITDPGALGDVGVVEGSRISGVPAFTGSAGAIYTQAINAQIDGFISADYSYTSNSVSLLVGGAGSEATRPGFSLVNMRFGVRRDTSELSLNVSNMFNAKPNLGDIGYVGYAQYTQAGSVIPQAATLQPATVMLQYTKSL